jgi:RNase P subunit RPR2
MARRRSRLNRDKRKGHALWSQSQLLSLIKDPSKYTPEQRSRFAQHLVKVSRRHRLRLPSEAKEIVCRGCNTLLRYGDNASIRIRNGHKIQTCFSCTLIRRIPYRQHSQKVKA